MRDPRRLIRAVLAPPLQVVRRLPGGTTVVGIVDLILPEERRADGERWEPVGEEPTAPPSATPDEDPAEAARAAIDREREPVERAPEGEDLYDMPPEGHVETEVELVAESAEPDATEPPGAELRVDEPWEGYRRMKVREITARLDGQPPEVLAAVELYESTHRARRGVLDAVRRYSRVAR